MWLSHTIFSSITAVTKIYQINEQQLFYYGDLGVYSGLVGSAANCTSESSGRCGFTLAFFEDFDGLEVYWLPFAGYFLCMLARTSIAFDFAGLISSFPLLFFDSLTDHFDKSTFFVFSGSNSMHL